MSNHEKEILVARMSAVVFHNGNRYVLSRNRTTVHADHPIVKGREEMFRSLKVDYPSDVPAPVPEPDQVEGDSAEEDKVGNDGSAVKEDKAEESVSEEHPEPEAEKPKRRGRPKKAQVAAVTAEDQTEKADGGNDPVEESTA